MKKITMKEAVKRAGRKADKARALAFDTSSEARNARIGAVTGSQWHNRNGGYVKV